MDNNREPMVDLFIFETVQSLEKLEQIILDIGQNGELEPVINEIFRIMHTIKGSAAMLSFASISELAHSVEDLFHFLREEKPAVFDQNRLTDLTLESVDFIKGEIAKIEAGGEPDGDHEPLANIFAAFLADLRNSSPKEAKTSTPKSPAKPKYSVPSAKLDRPDGKTYHLHVFYEDGCEMVSIRAFNVMNQLQTFADVISYTPNDIIENENADSVIQENGFEIQFITDQATEKIEKILTHTPFLRKFELNHIEAAARTEEKPVTLNNGEANISKEKEKQHTAKESAASGATRSMISVDVQKLDVLLDQVGELVISNAILKHNLASSGLSEKRYSADFHHLELISKDLQESVMSLRMVTMAGVFQKMNRLVHDMGKRLNKEITLIVQGEDTEVDRNVAEHLSDPLLHLIRNAADHGLETPEERIARGKSSVGRISLEAKNTGGEVWIIVKDDGRGLNREKIVAKAREKGLLKKAADELTDRDVYSFILMPGFSTKDQVTEFSGRGVGMDVVSQNIEKIGGTVLIDSRSDQGTEISIKIPLTLAVIDGMLVQNGEDVYTLQTAMIGTTIQAENCQVFTDPAGDEMIIARGQCCPVLRLERLFNQETKKELDPRGIYIMFESESGAKCLYVDALLEEQQVVVKALPPYLKTVGGVSGCTILGDGSISLILDLNELPKYC